MVGGRKPASRRFARAAAVLFALGICGQAAQADIITFDELNDYSFDPGQGVGQVPTFYHNLQWSNAFYIDPSVAFTPSGYSNGLQTTPNIGFSGFGLPADITAIAMTGTMFDFTSGYFAGAFRDGMTVTLTGVQADSTVLILVFNVDATSATFVNPGWTNLVSLQIASAGGVVHPGYIGSGTQLAFDNLDMTGFICRTSTGNDTCLVTSIMPQTMFTTDADGGTDTLQVGGGTNFNFDVSNIGPSGSFRHFETFQKIGASNVMLTGTAGVAANWNVIGGTLTASGGNSIGDTAAITVGGAGTLALANNETIGSLTGSGVLSLGANTLTTGGNNTSTAWSGSSSGTGGLTKTGTGTFTVNANLGYSGLTTVNQGTMVINGTVADSVLVAAGATLRGNASINGNLTNLGTVAPGNSPSAMPVNGNYFGGGTLAMDVEFDNAGTPNNGVTHDFLSIGGNVSGTTTINIIPDPPSGAPEATSGNGIELVRVTGSVTGSQFVLSGPVVQGGYHYVLAFVPTAGPDSFFLQSVVRDELWGHAALLSAGRAMTNACFRGDERRADSPASAQSGRTWAKFSGGSQDTGIDTGIDTSQDFSCGSGGIDFGRGENVRLGLSGGYGHSSVDVTTPVGMSSLDGNQGIVEAYVAYARNAVFMNLSLGYATTDWTYDGTLATGVSATADGFVGSMQVGMQWPLGVMRAGVVAEINYDGSSCGDTCLVASVSEDVSPWLAKASVRLDGAFSSGRILPYVAVSYADDLGGGDRVALGTAVIYTQTASNILGAQAGVTALVGDRFALFANAGLTEGLDKDVSGFNGQVGFKLYW